MGAIAAHSFRIRCSAARLRRVSGLIARLVFVFQNLFLFCYYGILSFVFSSVVGPILSPLALLAAIREFLTHSFHSFAFLLMSSRRRAHFVLCAAARSVSDWQCDVIASLTPVHSSRSFHSLSSDLEQQPGVRSPLCRSSLSDFALASFCVSLRLPQIYICFLRYYHDLI